MASELKPCPFCSKTMMLRSALWPSEGDADAIIHADPTDCPMLGFSDGSADGSIIEKWNCSLSNEDDFPSDGSCVRCGSVPRNANGLCNTCLDEDAERLENTRTTPVAPVSPDTDGKCGELVTVAKQHRLIRGGYPGSWQPYASPIFSDDVFETRELVTRSQAEELLAAERAEKEEARQAWKEAVAMYEQEKARVDPALKRVSDLEADNAAERAEKEKANARVEFLLKQISKAAEERTTIEADNTCLIRHGEALKADNAALTARIKELEQALETEKTLSRGDWACQREVDQMSIKVEALVAKLAVAEKALEFYRDGFKYHPKRTSTGINVSEWKPTQTLLDDCGETARAARGGKPS